MESKSYTMDFAGRPLTLEFGKYCEQANGSVWVHLGDTVVMVSDGVTQGREECPWLFDLLRAQGEDASVERIADLVVKYAKGEGASDDLSVLVMRIGEQK